MHRSGAVYRGDFLSVNEPDDRGLAEYRTLPTSTAKGTGVGSYTADAVMSQTSEPTPEITRLLRALRSAEVMSETSAEAGGADAADDLARAVHTQLERIARREFNKAGAGGLTIEPGVLADDALLKILGNNSSFENRRMFFAYATRIMVRELLNHQRLRRAQKRGGDWVQVTLSSAREGEPGLAVNVEHMPEILEELRELDARKADVVELKVFWGMTVPEISETLEVSASTVDREWRFAQRWLARELRHKANDK